MKTNYNTKRHMFFYEFETLWFVLTMLNIVAIFLIIRGSTVPLVEDNVILRFLFYSKETGDKTLYSIAISYFAAYIFYIIQVYYPERTKTKRTLMNIAIPALNLINQTSMFLFVWDVFTKKNTPNDGAILDVNIRKIYYKNACGPVFSADKGELRKIIGRVKESYEEILNDSAFQFCDNALRQLIIVKNIPYEINGLYKKLLSAEILAKCETATLIETYSFEGVRDIKARLRKLNYLLGLKCDFNYAVTTNAEDIEQREDIDRISHEVIADNLDYFSNLREANRKSLEQ